MSYSLEYFYETTLYFEYSYYATELSFYSRFAYRPISDLSLISYQLYLSLVSSTISKSSY